MVQLTNACCLNHRKKEFAKTVMVWKKLYRQFLVNNTDPRKKEIQKQVNKMLSSAKIKRTHIHLWFLRISSKENKQRLSWSFHHLQYLIGENFVREKWRNFSYVTNIFPRRFIFTEDKFLHKQVFHQQMILPKKVFFQNRKN